MPNPWDIIFNVVGWGILVIGALFAVLLLLGAVNLLIEKVTGRRIRPRVRKTKRNRRYE